MFPTYPYLTREEVLKVATFCHICRMIPVHWVGIPCEDCSGPHKVPSPRLPVSISIPPPPRKVIS